MGEVIPKAIAHFGFRSRIVVDKCPYCGKTHYHSMGGSDDDYQRLADCGRGEYILTFEPLKNFHILGNENR